MVVQLYNPAFWMNGEALRLRMVPSYINDANARNLSCGLRCSVRVTTGTCDRYYLATVLLWVGSWYSMFGVCATICVRPARPIRTSMSWTFWLRTARTGVQYRQLVALENFWNKKLMRKRILTRWITGVCIMTKIHLLSRCRARVSSFNALLVRKLQAGHWYW